jgi:Na+/proline symporter
VLGYNVNWHIAQRYYSVPDERDTQKMALWCAGLSLLLPLMWILPVLASRVLYPDLGAMWPGLAEPTEAAFVTLALDILPHGMLGIIVAAMFAATMSSADTMLNWLAAVLTRDAYAPGRLRLTGKAPSDKNQLRFGRLCVAAMGLVAIWIAFNMEKLGGVFDVHTKASSLYSAPMFIPVLLGLAITRTPWWSGIASFGFGVFAVIAVSLFANLTQGLPADSFASLFLDIELDVLGMRVTRYELQMLVGALASTACFLGSMAWDRRTGDYAVRIEALERDLATPALAPPDAPVDLRGLQAYRLTGRLTLIIGGMLFLMIFPTVSDGNWELNAAGSLLAILGGGGILWVLRNYQRKNPVAKPDTQNPNPEG